MATRKETPNASYTHRPQSRRNSGARSYPVMVEKITIKTPEAQNALEELERGSLKVLNENVKVRSQKESPFSRACFYIEEIFPEMLMQQEDGAKKAEAILEQAELALNDASNFLKSEASRIEKLISDGYVDVTLDVKHERVYEVSCSSVLYRNLIRLVQEMDDILLQADKLRFSGIFSVIQRKNFSRELHRNVIRAANKLTSLEGIMHKNIVRNNNDDVGADEDESTEDKADKVSESAQEAQTVEAEEVAKTGTE
jgi:hypothetical protein